MAHLSGDEGLIEAFHSGEDLHRFVGARVFGVDPADVTPTMRTKVKAMSYGLAYGLSPFGLSKQLRIETGEAKELIADYFARFGGIRDYLRGVVAAGEGGRLHHDDLRPAPAVHRPDLVQPGAARERRAPGAQLADPGLGRRHHQAARCWASTPTSGSAASTRACCCRCTTSSCSRSHRASWTSSATVVRGPDVGGGRAERPARRAGRHRRELGRSRALELARPAATRLEAHLCFSGFSTSTHVRIAPDRRIRACFG